MLYMTAIQIRAMSTALISYQASLIPGHPHEVECDHSVRGLEIMYERLPEALRNEIGKFESITSLFYDAMLSIVAEEIVDQCRESKGVLVCFIADCPEDVITEFKALLKDEEIYLFTWVPWRAIKFKNGNEIRFLETGKIPHGFTNVFWTAIFRLISTE
jgi:hypothetical protein